MASNDTLYMTLELKSRMSEQLEGHRKEVEKLQELLSKVGIDPSKIDIGANIKSNLKEAEKVIFKVLDVQEKLNKAISQGQDRGFDVSNLQQASARLGDIVEAIQNVGNTALVSKNAVKDLVATLNTSEAMKIGRDLLSEQNKKNKAYDSDQKKQLKEEQRDVERMEKARIAAEKEAEQAAHRNAVAQDRVRDALARIATARANLTAASEKGNQQEVAHAQLLISLLDRLAGKLNAMKGSFLGEKGALDGVLGSGYKGLMRNVSTAIRDIGKTDSNIIQKAVGFDRSEDIAKTAARISEIRGAMSDLANRINSLQVKWAQSPDEHKITSLREMQEVYKALDGELKRLTLTYQQLHAAERLGDTLGISHLRGYTGPQSALSDEAWQSAKREAEVREVATQAAEKHKQKLSELTEAFERQSKAEEKERQAQAAATAAQERATARQNAQYQARQKATQATRKQAEELVRLRIELLKTQSAELQGLVKNGKGVFSSQQYKEVQNALRAVREEMRQLEGVMQRMGSYSVRELFNFGRGAQNWSPLIQFGRNTIDANNAVSLLSDSERKFVESLSQANTALNRNGVLMKDLHTLTHQYLSLLGAKDFLNKIIETGGLLEQQRLSIGAILGSMEKAEVVFGKIKDLAIKSPFGVVELDKMSKQLTAYGFQYEELFDWTKRLADISAATGTEVSRLALALGHVRSEGALSGYTLRQFAMGNIPMLQKLSENLGITTKEVRARVKKKEISYEDVKKVMQDLTDEGGMFYNAQEIMSEALNAKFKNLRDAFDIMYGEIAESGVGDVLKKIAEALTVAAKEWKRFGTDIAFVSGVFLAAKASSAAFQMGMVALSKEMGLLAYNTKAYTATQLQQLASEGVIKREHLLRAVATGRLSVEQAKLAGATLGVSQATLQQAASSGKVTRAMLGNAIATSRFNVAQLRLMATLRAQGALFPVLRVGLMGLAAGFRTVAMAAKSFLPFLAIGAVVDVFSRYSQQMSAAKDSAKEAAAAISTGMSDIKSMYDSLSKKTPEDKKASVSNMIELLKDNGAYTSSIQSQVESTKDLNVQYDILYNYLQKIADSYEDMKTNVESYLEAANKVGGGWFTDNMRKDLEQFSQAVTQKDVAKARAGQYGSILKKEIEAMLKNEGKWIESTMRSMGWEDLLKNVNVSDLGSKLRVLEINALRAGNDAEAQKYEKARASVWEYALALEHLKRQREEVESQMSGDDGSAINIILAGIEKVKSIKELAIDEVLNWSDEDFEIYGNGLAEAISSWTDGMPSEVKEKVREMVISWFPKEVQQKVIVNLDKKEDKKEKELEQWQKDLNEYFKDHSIDITLTADDTIQSTEKKLQEFRKKAQEKFDSAGAIFVTLGIRPDMSAIEEYIKKFPWMEKYLKKNLENYNEGKDEVKKADEANKETGLSVKDKSKDKGSKTDARLKAWREELKELENFYKVYKRNAEYMSGDDAIQKALDSGVFSDPKKLPKNINDYLQVLTDFRKKVEAEMGKNPSTERKSFLTDLLTKIDEKEFQVKVKDVADAMLKQLDEELKKQGKQWDLYKKVLDATGSKEQAGQIAFGGSVRFDNYAEQLRSEIAEALKGNEKAKGLSIDELLGMDEKKLREDYGILGELARKMKELKEVEQQLKAEDVELFLDALKNAKSLQTELDQIKVKYDKTREAIAKSENLSPEEKARLTANADKEQKRSDADKRWEWFKKDNADWGRVFGNLDKMSTQTLKSMRKQLEGRAPSLSESVEATKDLYEAIEKIDKVTNGRNPIGTMADAIRKGSRLHQLIYSSGVFNKDGSGTFTPNKASAKYYGLHEGKTYRRDELIDMERGTKAEFSEGINGMVNKFKAVQDALTPVIDLFNTLGMTDVGEFFQMGSNALGAAAQMGSGAASLFGAAAGPWGAAIGAGMSVVSSLFAMHDKALQEEIEASKQRQKEMENLTKNLERALERTLGGIYEVKVGSDDTDRLRRYAERYDKAQDAKKRMKEGNATMSDIFYAADYDYIGKDSRDAIDNALRSESYYDTKYAELLLQRDELKHQLESEEDKKDSDSGAIEDYRQQIKEMEDEIAHFAEDMAKALYDIDIKSWASELGDALFDAWQKGEDGADAFRKKAREIITELAKKIAVTKLIETALKPVLKAVTDEMERTDGKLDSVSVSRISDAMAAVGETLPDAFNSLMDGLDEGMKRSGLGSMKDDAGESSSTSGIKSITEQTADVLLSYVNAIRGDVSVNRVTLQQILLAVQTQAEMPAIARAQLAQLEQIAGNTSRNAQSAAQIYDLLHRVESGVTAIKVK